jgi:hypothetical protein
MKLFSVKKRPALSGKAAGLFLSPLRLPTSLCYSARIHSLQTRWPGAEFFLSSNGGILNYREMMWIRFFSIT